MAAGEQNEDRAPSIPFLDPSRRSRKAATLTISAACVLAAAFAGAVRAADDAGVHEFIRSQAYQSRSDAAPSWPSRQARTPVSRPAPVIARHVPVAVRHVPVAVRHVREPVLRESRALAQRLIREPRARFASLPQAEERPAARKAKPVSAATPPKAPPRFTSAAGSDPIATLLRDPTLRPGDIVMFPDGARVFKGGRALPHAAGSFEDVGQSRLVSKASRKMVLALTKTTATPGKEAGLYLPKALSSAPAEAEQGARSEVVRVVYPAAIR